MLILGLGDTGLSLARWVEREGGKPRVADSRPHPPRKRDFTGELRTWSNTVVNLDALCNAITKGTGGCAGRSVHVAFTTVTDCLVGDDGWFIDDVQVSATLCPPSPSGE